jgi:hypothetical protein
MDGASGVGWRVLSQLLAELDGVNVSIGGAGVTVIGCTSRYLIFFLLLLLQYSFLFIWSHQSQGGFARLCSHPSRKINHVSNPPNF